MTWSNCCLSVDKVAKGRPAVGHFANKRTTNWTFHSMCFWLDERPTDAARLFSLRCRPCWSLPPRLDLNTSTFVHENPPRSLFCHSLVVLISILNPEQQLFPKSRCKPSNPKAPSAPNTDSQGDEIYSDNWRETEKKMGKGGWQVESCQDIASVKRIGPCLRPDTFL